MKTIKQVLVAAIAVTFMMSSCTVEKRMYTSGYHIDWFQGKSKASDSKTTSKTKKQKNQLSEETGDNVALESKKAPESKLSFSVDKSVATAASSPRQTPEADDNATASTDNDAVKQIITDISTFDYEVNENNKVNINAEEEDSSSSGKSQLIALILVILVGFGIHRFYLGYIGIGIIQLLTLGGCGIWWLIDLIRIVTGDLTPKDGPYSETL